MTIQNYYKKGSSTGVLLIHGCGGTPVELQYVANGLHDKGFTVYCPKLSGHGTNDEDLQNSNWKEWYQSACEAYEFMTSKCDRVIVGGLSAGALIALMLARDYPVTGTILFAPCFKLNGWAMPFYSRILQFVRPWMIHLNIMISERMPYGLKDDRVRNMVLNNMTSGDQSKSGSLYTPLKTIANFSQMSHQIRNDLEFINTPTLIFHPRNDDIADISNSYEIISRIDGDTELVVLDDSYHIITLDKQKRLVVEKSADFICNVEMITEMKKRKVNNVRQIFS